MLQLSVTQVTGSHAAVQNARARWSGRAALWLTLVDSQRRGAALGRGEACPLPGHGRDSLEAAQAALESLSPAEVTTLAHRLQAASPDELLQLCAGLEGRLGSPSAAFGLETALLDHVGRQRGVPLWQLWGAAPVAARLSTSVVLDPLASDLERDADEALALGISTLKLKLGRAPEAELEATLALVARFGSRVALRGDANQAWPRPEALGRLERLALAPLQLLEEPCVPLPPRPRPLPCFADESLIGVEPSDAFFVEHAPDGLVLKPMLLGGMARCLQWARLAQARGVPTLISHLFDGPRALSAAAHLAFVAQSAELAAGLGLHVGLAAWSEAPAAHVTAAALELPTEPGLGSPRPLAEGPAAPPAAPLAASGPSSARQAARPLGAPDVAAEHALQLHRAARAAPERLALVTADAAFTFQELKRAIQPLVRALGRAPESAPVAFDAPADTTTLLRVYACLQAGRTFLPLHAQLHPTARARLLHEASPLDEWPVAGAETARGGALAPAELMEPAAPRALEDDLVWLATSGSTARPKLVRLSRRAVLASAAASAINLGWRDDDRWLLSLPLAHVGGLSVVTRCLLARAAVVLDQRLPARAWAEYLERQRVTLLSLVPTQLTRLLDDPGFRFPPRVRAVLLGGAAASTELLARARAREIPVLTTYGMTETCSQLVTASTDCVGGDASSAGSDTGLASVGRPLRGVELQVDAAGLLRVRAPQLFSGYVGQASPFDADGYFHTSDRAELTEQGVQLLGRADNVVVSGGENVAPEAVEAQLSLHPAIAEVCVVGALDPLWGEALVAFVVLREPLADAALDAWARERLTNYQRPKRYLRIDALPRLPTGKLDRRALKERGRTLEREAT